MSSSGGATGVTTEYIRDAQDVTLQLKRRLISTGYQQNLLNHIPNSTGDYLSSLLGARECVLPVLNLSPSSISQNEGNDGTTSYTYTVTRIGSANCAVSWEVTGSPQHPAAVGSDFVGGILPRGVVHFATGDVTKSIVILVVGDTTFETGKFFDVTLSNPINATIGFGVANGIIMNDDDDP